MMESLADEYKQRKASLDRNLQKVIKETRVAHMEVSKKTREEIEEEKKQKEVEEAELAENPLARLMADVQQPQQDQPSDILADGFVRSKRAQQLRVKDSINDQINEVGQQKTALIQKLNKALLKLDKINQQKKELSTDLLEMVKFVRDLQKAASGGDDIEGIVSAQMKRDFQREKEMNYRLQEELKRCEKERLRILERIKYLGGEKEVVVETTSGVKKTFKVTQVNIERMLSTLESQKRDVDANVEMIKRSEEIVHVTDAQIREAETELDRVRHERDTVAQQFSDLEHKYRLALDTMEGRKWQANSMHRMHVKLLATRQFEETLQKVFCENKRFVIDHLLYVTRGYVNQFGAVTKFRSVLISSNRRVARNAMQRWFKLACDPIMLINQNDQIPRFFAPRIQGATEFARGFENYMSDQRTNLTKQVAIDRMWGNLDRLWKKWMKLRFIQWRDNVIAKNRAVKTLDYFFTKNRRYRQVQVITKWKHYVLDQDFHIQMHGVAVQLSCAQLQQGVFFEWRIWAGEHKRKRQDRMRRVFKNLKVATQRRKQLQRLAASALGFKRVSNGNILKQCFDALRQNKEEEVLHMMKTKLNEDTAPAIRQLQSDFDQTQRKDFRDVQMRCMKALMNPCGRQIAMYFDHWKRQANNDSVQLNQNFKVKLIRLYRGKIEKAFALWKKGRSHKAIVMQMEVMEEFQQSNIEMETEDRKIAQKIRQKDESMKSVSSRHVKKLMTSAFQRHLKHFFDRWAKKNQAMGDQEHGAGRILKKVRTRMLRIAWNRYLQGQNLIEQEGKNEKKLSEAEVRLNFKIKKRMYNAIKAFTMEHRSAKSFLRNLIKKIDKHNKGVSFRIWKDFLDHEHLIQKQGEQAELVDQMAQNQQAIGDASNKLQAERDRAGKADRMLKTAARRTLSKWYGRATNASLAWAFETWSSNKNNLKHREQLFLNVRAHIFKNQLRSALARWRQEGNKGVVMEFEEMVMEEENAMKTQGNELRREVDNRRKQADQCARKAKIVNDEKQKLDKEKQNMIVNMMERNQGMFFNSKLRHFFGSWREGHRRRKKGCQSLCMGITKLLQQKSFTEIKQFSRETNTNDKKEKTSNKLVRTWHKFRLKKALAKWREQEFQQTMMMIEETTVATNQMVQGHQMKVKNVKKHRQAVQTARKVKTDVQKYFDALRKHSFEARDFRLRSEKVKDAYNCYRAKRAIMKWHKRTETTHRWRHFLNKGKYVKRNINMRTVFEAWKREYIVDRAVAYRTQNIMNNLKNLQMQKAFDMIMGYAHTKNHSNNNKKLSGKQKMINALKNYNLNQFRLYFNHWKKFNIRRNDGESKLNKALRNMATVSLRSYFAQWKMVSFELGVEHQNEEEDGPTNLEAWALREKNLNLIKMLKKDGLTNSEIEKIQEESNQKYKTLVEKSLCRMLCKGGDDLYLLPSCLDKWKKYTQMRKLWRRYLDLAESRMCGNTSKADKLWAFRRLQYSQNDRENCLQGKPIEELRKMCLANVDKLDAIAETMDNAGNEEKEMTAQRNVLLQGQIAGQKLAFALSCANQEKLKQRAMLRWVDNGKAKMNEQIEEGLSYNIAKIQALKDRIAQLEKQNDEFAAQNDTFRAGAMDGITMVRHVEELTKDRDKLSVDLADKALTIRKLLEDHSYLQSKLKNVQNQTQSLMGKAPAGLRTLGGDENNPNRLNT